MKLVAGAAVVLAVGAGLGTYFALRGSAEPQVPKAQQSPILERAKAKGVITEYRVRRFDGEVGRWAYAVDDDIGLASTVDLCTHGPACLKRPPLVTIEYRRTVAKQAATIYRIAQAQMPKARIKLFETTTLGG